MHDQAEKLRKLVQDNPKRLINKDSKVGKSTRIIAVTSGKGGVGKTNFTLNLAISLNNLGYSCIVFDADIGFANIDVISGVIPKYNIADVINGKKRMKEIIEDTPSGVKIISGGSGINEIMRLDLAKIEYLINEFKTLENEADYILIDTGAGLSNTVLSFVNSADEVIVVTTPEPTSLTDGYAMIKALTLYNANVNIKVIINRVSNPKEADEVFEKLNKVTSKFLNMNLVKLGYIYDSKVLIDAVKNQIPFLEYSPTSSISRNINTIAVKLVGVENSSDNTMSNFLSNLRNVFTKGRL